MRETYVNDMEYIWNFGKKEKDDPEDYTGIQKGVELLARSDEI